MRALLVLLLAAIVLLPGTGKATAQDNAFDTGGQDPFAEGPDSGGDSEATKDESTPAFEKAMELWRKKKYSTAKKAGRAILKKYPNSVHRDAIENVYFGDNSFLGVERLHEGGPSSRRIDVAVMGDGFVLTSKSQKQLTQWADLVLKVLFVEDAFEEYKDYFNYYHVRLESADERVDLQMTDEQKKKWDEKNKRRAKKKKYEFDTALGCRQAGPQRQVASDRKLVYKWLGIANEHMPGCGEDGLVIVFAQFGELGMGGGGIANCGRPDKSVTVHEFGHAFVGLLDEYANTPGPPRWAIRAPNATTDPENPPWKHFLDAKVKGVGVYEGGATCKKGVWRPAQGCGMNSAGNSKGYCPVCREAAVLRIYSYVSPIDMYSPSTHNEVKVVEGDEEKVLSVLPMQPKTHDLEVTWLVEKIADADSGPPEKDDANSRYGNVGRMGGYTGGTRHRDNERAELLGVPPSGDPSKLGKKDKGKKGEPTKHRFLIGRLEPGRFKVTAVVKDTTKWVLKDEQHLLEERLTWWVTVAPKAD